MLRALGVQPTKRLPRQLTQQAEDVGIFEELTGPESVRRTEKQIGIDALLLQMCSLRWIGHTTNG